MFRAREDQSLWNINIIPLDSPTILVDSTSRANSGCVWLGCDKAERLFYSLELTLVGKPFNPVAHWSMEEVPRCFSVLVFTSHVGYAEEVFRWFTIDEEFECDGG